MKRLEDFKKNEVLLKSIWGGTIVDTPTTTKTNSDGCKETTGDYFYDTNGNGKQDKGETGGTCVTISC